MKKKLYLIATLALSATVVSLSSCLKDSRYVDFSAVGTLIELPLEAFNGPGKLVAEALPIQDAPQIIPVVVNVASPKPLTSALTVTLIVDQAALTAYNHANGLDTGGNTPYILPPTEAYSFPSLKVTIPANQRTANLNISIFSSKLDPSAAYILPISIADASGQKISNYKTVLYNVQAKNQYDGEYTVTGTLNDVLAPANTGAYPEDVYLETASANSVTFNDVDVGGQAHLINGGASYYGNFAPVFTFDASNKVTAVTNYYGNPSPSQARGARIDPSGANAYTTGTPGAAGSVIKIKYVLTQAGSDKTFFDETFTYKGKRP